VNDVNDVDGKVDGKVVVDAGVVVADSHVTGSLQPTVPGGSMIPGFMAGKERTSLIS
jgi:hypothetical protein